MSFRVAKILKDELTGDFGESGRAEQKSDWVLTTKDTKHTKTDERKEHESTLIFTNLISVN